LIFYHRGRPAAALYKDIAGGTAVPPSSPARCHLVRARNLAFLLWTFFSSRASSWEFFEPPLYAALLAVVHFLIYVTLVRFYSAVSDRDATFLAILSFAGILAAAVLTVTHVSGFLLCFSVVWRRYFCRHGIAPRRRGRGHAARTFSRSATAG